MKSSKTALLVGALLVAVAGAGLYAYSTTSSNSSEETASTFEETTDTADTSTSDTMAKVAATSNDEAMTKAGAYIPYSSDALAATSDGKAVIFFSASWCPDCVGLDKDINANISEIPSGVSILKADYDSTTELKQKYGVTTQHTMVQVDADGNLIKKWTGSPTLAELTTQIN